MLMHIAYVLILASFLVKDVLWLRLLSIAGGGVWIAFFTFLTPIDWGGIGWNVFFGLINLWHVSQIVIQRRPVQLSSHERELKHLVFPELSDRHWSELLNLSERSDTLGTIITEEETPNAVYLISRGHAQAHQREGKQTLPSGTVVGGISYLTGQPTHERIECEQNTEVLMWPISELKVYLERTPAAMSSFQRIFGLEIARQHKYAQQRTAAEE